jgi:hypothetical protein
METVGAVWVLARREIRRRWRSALAIALLVGVVGAIALAAGAGARRSSTALDRFNDETRSAHIEMNVGSPTPRAVEAFARTAGIASMAQIRGYAVTNEDSGLAIAAPVDGAFDHVVDRSLLIEGRRPDPRAAHEVTVSEGVAERLRLRPGSTITTRAYTQPQIDAAFEGRSDGSDPPAGPSITFEIVGIVRRPLDLGIKAATEGTVVLTPAFVDRYDQRVGKWTDVLRVRTVRGSADVERINAAARAAFGDEPIFGTVSVSADNEGARDAIEVLTLALWIVAGVTAVAGLVTITIVLARDAGGSDLDQATLRGLGLTGSQRAMVSGPRAVLVAGGGALLAGAGAIVLSPFFPIGIARQADPDPGFHADWLVLGVGIALVFVLASGVAFLVSHRAARPAPERVHHTYRATSAVTERIAATGTRPTLVNGVRMAIQPGMGRHAIPVRSALFGAIVGVAGAGAALVFGASLGHLAATPGLYGWNWDVKAEIPASAPCVDTATHGVGRVRGVEGVGVAAPTFDAIEVDGRPVTGWCFRSIHGHVGPVVVEGRAPAGRREIALGTETLEATGKDLGDTVRVRGPGPARDYRVVGRVVLPSVGEPQALADGAAVSAAAFPELYETAENETHFLLVRTAGDVDREALDARLDAAQGRNVGRARVPVEIERLEQIDRVPLAIAALLGALALVAVAHALVTSVRRRRAELAMLKVLGFTRGQLRATVGWQATVLAVVGLVIGLPLGLVVGRWTWSVVTHGLGVQTVVSNPALWLLFAVPIGVLIANLLALLPARAAARTRPAVALRET